MAVLYLIPTITLTKGNRMKFEVTNIKTGGSFVLTNKTVLEKHLLHEIMKDAENNQTFKVTTLNEELN